MDHTSSPPHLSPKVRFYYFHGPPARPARSSLPKGSVLLFPRPPRPTSPLISPPRFGFIISTAPPPDQPAKVFVYHSHIKTTEGFRYLRPGTMISML